MGHCSIRSLLVAAIVVSNCITWTASRHHYTHNVHGHRSRHRRQGAGLFLSSSYVIPGGEGTGAWGEWGEVSPCSRTCGGGVASQKRICLEVGPDGQPLCRGGDTKFFSCQTQDCPDGAQDFRAQQCSEYNDVAFKGIKYQWVPYTKGPNPCELNCMPRGERFYYRQKPQVVDGTRCNEESFDVCVNGTCQPVGCDMMLGSAAREDKCRECRGNGTNCHTVNDLLDTQDLRSGYNDVLLIPAGATNIYIAEVRPSSNYLALRATTNGTYYLNGDYHIDFPRSIDIAGVTWHYERSQNGLPSPDKLKCLGPTDEPLFLSLLVQEPNVGIEYEYSIPKELAPPPNQEYNWVHDEFSPCSASCGGGIQTRNVTCRSREELEVVDEGLCNAAFRPDANQTCNPTPCPAQWVKGPWGECSKHCGEGGIRRRQVHCKKIIKNGYPTLVANKECIELLGPMPALYEECNQNATCPIWFTGPWKPCDKLCDEGKQTRQVVCYQKTDGRVEVLDDKECLDEKPPAEQSCMLQLCEGVDWVLTDWVGCDTCLSKVRTRSAVCATRNRKVVNSSFCSYHNELVLEEPCDLTKLPPCEVQWYATQWSNCSAECGKGIQTRRVFCGMFDGESVLKVPNDRCKPEEKYNDTRECEVKECPALWYAGPWTECSEPCDGGTQHRRVMCLRGTEVAVGDCPMASVLDSTQACNLSPCNEDQVTMVGPNATPIMDDYDDECEIEEEFAEVGAEEDDSLSTFPDEMFSDSPYTPELPASFSELESEFTAETGSGETLITEGSGFGSTDSTFSTDEWTSEETSSTDETSFTTTDETTESGATDSSSPVSEPTAVKVSGATDESSPSESTESTVESSTTESNTTGSTESEFDIDETGSTESDATESSDLTTESGSTEPTESKPTEVSGSDGTTESGATESSGPTESTVSEETETTESESTDETESTATDETETTESTLSSESSPTDETSESSSESETTEETTVSGSTESSGSTEAGATEGSTVSDTEETGSTEAGATTESGATEASESTESGATEVSGSSETTETGSTESPGSTESGATEGTTESGATEETEATESESTDLTTESGSTEAVTEGSTESPGSTETTESGPTSESEETEATESSTTEGSTESVSEDTGSTVTEETGSTETGVTESEETTVSGGSTLWDWSTTVVGRKSASRCLPRAARCKKTKFGCCPDKKTPAAGPFDEGCPHPKTCNETRHGCCPDGVSPAAGPKNKGCPTEPCAETLFGCCKSDNKTPAEGNDQEGCPPPPPACRASKYGCCKDDKTQATGPGKAGCPETTTKKPQEKGEDATTTILPEGADCNATEFGCCPDGVSPAGGAQMEGCVMSCNSSAYGCCPDGETPAHGYEGQGCCLASPHGCCPDNYKPAEGPHLEGCGCQYAHFGCCPDNVTIATGPNNEGCGCQYTEHGCCPDRHTPASGPEFEGCDCHTYQFGCCDDGVTIAKGPGRQGCLCQQTEFGCCGDGKTAAVGPDQLGCDCSNSKFGCCPDGKTAANGTKFFGCTDKPENRQAACALSTDRGPCTNYSVYWYYDLQYGGCSRFWYGGCEGNGNRFTSKDECEDVCVQPSPQDACNLPKVKGACTGYHPRWYYDPEREQCGQFIFGGCLGNANNFDSRELCQKQCEPAKSDDQCSLPIDRGTCAGNFLRYGFNSETRRCEPFVWGGCGGNNNRFGSEAACEHHCNPPGVPKPQCKEPKAAGNCTEKLAKWSFSQTEDRCVPFYYTGCGGNDNQFDSLESCSETCPSSYEKDICTLPAVTGECINYTEMWYYDTSIERCRQFYYGGCGGNENRFASEAQCQAQCTVRTTTQAPPTPPQAQTVAADVCTLPSETGECDRYTEQWFFDSSISRCRPFYYGGCGGNGNRFESEAACASRCAATPATPRPAYGQEICFMEADSGPCTDAQPRWTYDAARGACTQFTYGGCGGNQNNFPTEEHCSRTCGATQDLCQLPMLSGPCEDSIMSWFYDPASDSCSQFTYSGCGGNGNRFDSLEACEERCRTGPAPVPAVNTTVPAKATTPATPTDVVPPICRVSPLPNEECVGEGVVWYLDPETRVCTAFTNEARGPSCRRSGVFPTEEACERSCGAFRDLEVCRYPVDAGQCRAAIPKFYYNEALGSCVEFAYGGCQGGPNRFSTLEECEDTCKFEKDPCKKRPKPINCFDYVTAWFFDESRDECFQYGSCNPNDGDRFATREECEGQCRRQPPGPTTTTTTPAPRLTPQPSVEDECTTPSSLAPCGNNVTVYYYDSERRACLRGGFGGCGHPNSYSSEEECERRCGAFAGLDPCRWPLDVGTCNSAVPKYYWKLSSGRCERYAYSGCGGGPNRFSTEDECLNVCGNTGPDPACLEPVSVGEACGAPQTRRWYYSEAAAQCLGFVYLGCGGGGNNFLSPQACQDACQTFDGGNEVLPDCDRFNEECAALRCEFGVQRTRGADGCERCACVTTEVDCAPLQQECEDIKCSYGIDRTVGRDGCERCTCFSHPCEQKQCPPGERCVATPYKNAVSEEIAYTADCRVVNKPGSCPLEQPSQDTEGRCRRECNDDADCRGVGKCCERGCSQLCLEPSTPTTPSPVTTTITPELPSAPQANPVTEPEVTAAEGGKATLRCLFHGNPPPKITWRRGLITIDGDVGRYRLMSDGALEIVSLYRNDSGVYICVAENIHGISQQEVRLQVNDPMDSPAGIAGEPDGVVVGELGRSLNIRCLAYGYPQPSIYWYYGRTMLPYSSELYEARENVLQIRKLELETLGEYSCQAFNGVGKAAFWSVSVRAYQPDERWTHPLLVPRERTVEVTPARPLARTTQTTPAPEIDMPVYTVPVNTSIPFEQLTQAVGGELSLPCDVDGYPLPEVYWTKDNARLTPNSRTQITDSRLTISGLTEEDSGVYGCHATNAYSSHSSQIQINVQGVFIPPHCTDNPFFADCKLIVRSKFCNHQYYSRFCCESCVRAGQLDALVVGQQADQPFRRRK